MMALDLNKKQSVDLGKLAPAMRNAQIGLGWKVRSSRGENFDLDASVMLVGADDKAQTDLDFVYYRNTTHRSGGVVHSGDDRVGGDGNSDNETISFSFDKIPDEIKRAYIIVSIDRAAQRRQNFGQVTSAYVRIIDADRPNDTSAQVRWDLDELGTETAIQFGVLERNDDGETWSFYADMRSFSDLADAVTFFGLEVA